MEFRKSRRVRTAEENAVAKICSLSKLGRLYLKATWDDLKPQEALCFGSLAEKQGFWV
jgi:hypothetical protein